MKSPSVQRTSVPLLVGLLFFSSCSPNNSEADSPSAEAELQAESLEPAQPLPLQPAARVTDLAPNEVGEIMVLEYHRLGEPQGEFYRSFENFQADLRALYEAGFRPITVAQMIDGDISVAPGATPVVFSFDDSSLGQFYYLEDGSIDPNTMVGAWEAFRAEHPDWNGGATWCVLPAADYPSNFFGDRPSREVERPVREELIQRKIDFLLDHGHEICNHTLYHARLDRAVSPEQVQEWIGRGEDSIRVYLPQDYRFRTFALPLGVWPEDRELAYRGTYNGRDYQYDAVLEVTGGPNESPFDVDFDPLSINRVIVAPGMLERMLERYRNHPELRFVSDGRAETIAVPADSVSRVDPARWPGKDVVPLPGPGQSGT